MTYKMWVCAICKTAQWHPLIYCPNCPGRLKCVQTEIQWPFGGFKTEEEGNEYLKKQGLKPTGK